VKRLLLLRDTFSDDGVFGTLETDTRSYDTVERPWLDNQPNISCIPGGLYRVEWTLSPKYKRMMYLILGDHKREGIRIHSANWAFQLQGCIALGTGRAPMAPPGAADPKLAVLSSKDAVAQFEKEMAEGAEHPPFELEIKEARPNV